MDGYSSTLTKIKIKYFERLFCSVCTPNQKRDLQKARSCWKQPRIQISDVERNMIESWLKKFNGEFHSLLL
ncbi:hypothetical protein Hanom_Chr12g01080741 [Helianthus anomalus]